MAVIIDMDMPSRCDECPFVTNSECPIIGIDVEEEMGSRDINCPLKSTDEMIAEIEQLKVWNDGETVIKYGSLTIIHKYCDKEQKYGNND